MGFMKEFKEFAVKGNAVDLAVGIVIGAAFGNIVNSLVNDIIMPIVGLLLGGVDFKNFFVNLTGASCGEAATLEACRAVGVPVLAYGAFVNTIINFLIIALAIFLIIRQINKMRK